MRSLGGTHFRPRVMDWALFLQENHPLRLCVIPRPLSDWSSEEWCVPCKKACAFPRWAEEVGVQPDDWRTVSERPVIEPGWALLADYLLQQIYGVMDLPRSSEDVPAEGRTDRARCRTCVACGVAGCATIFHMAVRFRRGLGKEQVTSKQ